MMKVELNEEQIGLILDGLDALSDAATEENRVATDPEILESNDTVIKDAAELYEYIANYKEG